MTVTLQCKIYPECPTASVSGFSLYNYVNITVMAEGGLDRNPPPFILVTSTDPLRQKLNQMRCQQHFIDYTIKCDPVEIRCHKVVITPQCAYFDKMLFQADMAEMAKQSIDLGLLNSDALLLVIEFLYTGRIEVEFTAAKDVLKVVSHLGLSDNTLLEKLSAYVVEHLNAENCLGWFDFASQLRMTSIKEEANNTVMRRFADVFQGAEFLDLSFDQLADYMKRKLDEEDADRDQVLKAVVRWIMHCVDGRKEHFEEIVKLIDLTKCSAGVLKTIFNNHGAVLISSTHLLQEFTSAALSLATVQQPKYRIIVTGLQFREDKYNRKTWRLNLINCECVEKPPHTADKFGAAFCSCPKGTICIN